jgi:hypothetical protein
LESCIWVRYKEEVKVLVLVLKRFWVELTL